MSPNLQVLHINTPVFEDVKTSARIGKKISFKMECFQPTGSFKLRGIGRLCAVMMADGVRQFVSSSGGNAGYAAAYAGRQLGIATKVILPSTTPEPTQKALKLLGAEIEIHGDVWDVADQRAREYADKVGAGYVPPFDHPVLWDGHATMVDELAMSTAKPDAIVVSVGGGGLMCGVLTGLHSNGWQDVPVIAVETAGADSFSRAVAQGELVTLPAITSVAKSLGARRVASEALAWTHKHAIHSVVVSDEAAVQACLSFADDQRVIVEPACGASLSIAYDNHPVLANAKSVVVIACGGITTDIQDIIRWRRLRGL